MATTTAVIDVNERDFAEAVLQRSAEVPVVVDFWAPWCGPCRVLGPVLERLAGEMNGAFVLAKLNVDQNQRLSAQYGIQGIPAVKAFKAGNVVDEFTGALPERDVRAWLAKLVPSEAEQLADAAALLEASDPRAAADTYRRALRADKTHGRSLLGLGRVLTLLGDQGAAEVLQSIKAGTPEHAQAQALIKLGAFMEAGVGDVADARQRLALDPNNSVARWQLAALLARQQQWEDALRHLLAIVQQDRSFGNDAARQAMVSIFAVLGERHPLTVQYRRQLASALF